MSAGQASDGRGRPDVRSGGAPRHSGGVAPPPRSTPSSPANSAASSIELRLRRDLEEIRLLAERMQQTGIRIGCLAADAHRAFDAWQLAAAGERAERERVMLTRLDTLHALAEAGETAP